MKWPNSRPPGPGGIKGGGGIPGIPIAQHTLIFPSDQTCI